MKPRNLRVLRIDDGLHDAERAHTAVAVAPVAGSQSSTVEAYTVEDRLGSVDAINSWSTALRLWTAAPAAQGPDLVIADVIFEADDSSPLACVQPFMSYQRLIPTGLCHLKPFAALSRARARPLGIGIHTRNASIWAEAWADKHPMAALAAHEIGELAAMLGDLLTGSTLEERVQSCWAWLKNNSRDDASPALRIALADYRRRLVAAGSARARSVVVLPQDWARLSAWVESRRGAAPAPLEPERSIPLLYSDGTRDLVRLVSLFGEVKDIATRPLPASCFDTAPANTGDIAGGAAWSLDDDGNPQIGRFIASLGSIAGVYQSTVALTARFPLCHADGEQLTYTLVDEAKQQRDPYLVAGLAVLFQVLKWEHSRYQTWQQGLIQKGWIAADRRLSSSRQAKRSLGETLKILARAIRAVCPHMPFILRAIPDALDEFDVYSAAQAESDWVRWHFDRLVDAGILIHHVVEQDYQLARKGDFSIDQVPAPPDLPPGFPTNGLEELRSTLRDSFGFGVRYGPNTSDNENAIGIRLATAFCDSTDPHAGRTLLDRILGGYGPPWLLELLRQYASEQLDWLEERTWPRWLQRC